MATAVNGATQYRQGAAFERATRTRLIDDGYDVLRSAGSKTKVDLIAIKKGQIVFVQCKRSGKLPPDERAALLHFAALLPDVDALPVLAYKPGPRGGVAFALLTGPGPRDRQPWAADEIAQAAS